MINTRRKQRMIDVLQRRLGWVHCAIEALHHRHNTSAVLRTCDAMGLHHVHEVQGSTRQSRGPAKGAGRWLNVHAHADPGAAIRAIQQMGCSLWVADLGPEARSPEEVPLDRPICLWFGAELVGVCEEARSAADGVMMIPMHGFSQSLNVSVAAALALRAVSERARAERGEAALLTPELRASVLQSWLEREEKQKKRIRRRSRHGASSP